MDRRCCATREKHVERKRANSADAAPGQRREKERSASQTRTRGSFQRNLPFFPSCLTSNENAGKRELVQRNGNEASPANKSVPSSRQPPGSFHPMLAIRNLAKELRTFFTPLFPLSHQSQANATTIIRESTAGQASSPIKPKVHTIVEYSHVLVPDMDAITNAPYYWGRMDRHKAEELLEGKPEGTFLLRDSAQLNYLFSVSFRRYSRTLHARVEHQDGVYSFDVHDRTIFSARKMTDLIKNYKDPARCFFFEPQLLVPFHRNFVFSLQHLCRSKIASLCTYEAVTDLPLPTKLKKYIREYHYKESIRTVEREH